MARRSKPIISSTASLYTFFIVWKLILRYSGKLRDMNFQTIFSLVSTFNKGTFKKVISESWKKNCTNADVFGFDVLVAHINSKFLCKFLMLCFQSLLLRPKFVTQAGLYFRKFFQHDIFYKHVETQSGNNRSLWINT